MECRNRKEALPVPEFLCIFKEPSPNIEPNKMALVWLDNNKYSDLPNSKFIFIIYLKTFIVSTGILPEYNIIKGKSSLGIVR